MILPSSTSVTRSTKHTKINSLRVAVRKTKLYELTNVENLHCPCMPFIKSQHQDRLQELPKYNEGLDENGNPDSVQSIFLRKFPTRSLGIIMLTNWRYGYKLFQSYLCSKYPFLTSPRHNPSAERQLHVFYTTKASPNNSLHNCTVWRGRYGK